MPAPKTGTGVDAVAKDGGRGGARATLPFSTTMVSPLDVSAVRGRLVADDASGVRGCSVGVASAPSGT